MIAYKKIFMLFTLIITTAVHAETIFVPRELSLVSRIGVDVEIPSTSSRPTKISDVLPKIQEAWNQTFDDHYDLQQFILLDQRTKRPIFWLENQFPVDYNARESGLSFIIGEYVRFQVKIATRLLSTMHTIPIDYITTIANIKRKFDSNTENVDLFLVIHAANETQQDNIVVLDGDADIFFNRIKALCPQGDFHIIVHYKSLPIAPITRTRASSAPPTTLTRPEHSVSASKSTLAPSQSMPMFPVRQDTPTTTQPGPGQAQ